MVLRLRVAPSWPLLSPPARSAAVIRRSFASAAAPRAAAASAAPPQAPPAVIGSAPELQRHLLIHTPHPTSTWPSHLEAASRLARHLQEKWQANPTALAKSGFNFTDGGRGEPAQAWDPERSKFDKPADGTEAEWVPFLWFGDEM